MTKKLISVIIPTYNSEKTILRCLDSVFKQTYQNFEIVICDDKSTDNTREILNDINNPKVKVLYLEENSGSAAARNAAMKHANGDYIAFLDSDDEWYPEKLKKQIPYFSDKSVGLIFAGAKIIKNEKHIVFHKPKIVWEQDSYRKLFLGQIHYITSTAIFRRDSILKTGYMAKELRRNQDYDLFLRILKHYNLKIIQTPLSIFNVDTKKTTSTRLRSSIEFYETKRKPVFKADFSQKEVNFFFARKYRDLTGSLFRSREYISALKSILKSLSYSSYYILKPKNIGLLFRSFIAGLIYK